MAYFYENWLISEGVSEDETYICMKWAFGDDFFGTQQQMLPDRWNQRHGDLFIMYDSDDLYDRIIKVGKAYLEHKKTADL